MTRKLPLGKIKDVAIGTLKDPRKSAESVVAQARGGVALGRGVMEGVVGQVSHRISERVGHSPVPAPRPPAPEERAPRPAHEEPAPTKAAPTKAAPTKAPASDVPTPAQVAPHVARQTPEQKALQDAATPRRTPVKKAAPGAKLPPRRAE
ncbi:MAG: hypothetical protein ACXVD0_09275 [Nocardioides sp.]